MLPSTYGWVALGAAVQGLAGLGFSLIVAPAVVTQIPGSSGVGTVNLLASVQNVLIILRTDARIRLDLVRASFPALLAGEVLGVLASQRISNGFRGLIVAGSALLSAFWILRPPRKIRRGSGPALFAWGAFVNTIASVGGPPVSSHLIRLIPDPEEYIRTQQVVFLALNLLSLPWLGVEINSGREVGISIGALLLGSLAGQSARKRLPPRQARQIAIVAILLVAGISFARAAVDLTLH